MFVGAKPIVSPIDIVRTFKKEKRFPSFKKKAMLNDSFACLQKWRLGRGQDGDKLYCSVLCEYEIEEQEPR